MLPTIGAWTELLKIGGTGRTRKKELRAYYRALSFNVLRKEGLFDFLVTPQSVQSIANRFGYTDIQFLTKYLDAYTEDEILIRENGTYRTNGIIKEFAVIAPDIFNPGLQQIASDGAAAIPDRLRGQYSTFSDEMNTFNWDDALQLKMYDHIRNAAFGYSGALKRRGKFIDVGCGNGVGTAAIWGKFYKRGAFESGNPMKMYALEYDPNLKQIAEEEFPLSVSRLFNIDRTIIDNLSPHYPTFVQGSAEELPFEDEFFDMVYTSQVLHWCDAERATKEMMRILKPGGLFFGTEAFYPMLDIYVELNVLLNEGAHGAIMKEEFIRWVKEAGASEVKTATPAGLFKVLKS
ncbi:MAG: class I SAM-dependent methyltransferase [Candidatus Thorarchaeota archaeon]|nr:class I SAM-dependent methyltransferase [Candidatus Thorarchaeota archaeon]